ncbi:hypothetical protein BASA83_006621 [Batrachochytrium salamandrivorans]|nr:hypothetical protein BASA83_006621 [Batrachochytrium salamandrivorans]
MSFEYYRTTDSIARQRSATSTSRRSSISATSFLLMDFGWIPQNLGCSELADTKESPGLASSVRIYKLYRALIHDYSSMTANLTKLFKKDAPFVWGPEQEKSLQDLKTAFANSDFLTHPDDSKPFILETDASDYAISGVLSQYDDSNTPPKLTRRQARWSLELSEYDFSLTHRPGKLNGRADSLSRREDYKSNTESSNFQRILDPSKVVDLQSLVADMDLHLLLHSQVLEKVFVLESDWPLIIADFLAGEDNVWMDDVRKSSWRDANGSEAFPFPGQ